METNTSIKHADTDFLLEQYSSLHEGIVRKTADPEGRGRVRVEVPGIRGAGEDNWTDWLEVAGLPFGGLKGKGDYGIWWPMQAGQRVKVGYLAGDNTVQVAIPCNTFQDKKGKLKQLSPKECKACDKDSNISETRLFALKTPSGASLIFDDNKGQEAVQLCDWMGAGLKIDSPSNGQDEQEDEEKGESKVREDPVRGTRSTWQGDSHKTDKTKHKSASVTLFDVNGSGFSIEAKDGASVVQIKAIGGHGQQGPMITLSSKDNLILLEAGTTQLIVNGPKNQIETTYTVIQEKVFSKAPKEYKAQIERALKLWAQRLGYHET